MYKVLTTLFLLVILVGSAFAQTSEEQNQYDGDGFSFNYPDGWTLSETGNLVHLQKNQYRLNIHTDEVLVSLPAGEFERRKLIGQYGVPVDVLVYESQVKQVLYGRLETPDTSLTILLEALADADVDYEDITIPQGVIQEANWIVSTITFSEVEPDNVTITPFYSGEDNPIDSWLGYNHPTEPFTFRYPDTWTLVEGENQIVLSQDEAQFVIAYAASDEPQPTIDPELMVRSNMVLRSAVYGLFQAIPSQAVDPDDGGAFGIIYAPVSTEDNHFTFWVQHSDTGSIDWAIGDEVDRIISTFQVRPQSNR